MSATFYNKRLNTVIKCPEWPFSGRLLSLHRKNTHIPTTTPPFPPFFEGPTYMARPALIEKEGAKVFK